MSDLGERFKNAVLSGSFKTNAELDAWGAGLQVAMLDGDQAAYMRANPSFGATKAVGEVVSGAIAARSAAAAGEAAAASLAKTEAAESLAGVPGRVLSRVNVSAEGMDHVVARHLSGKANASQFSISEEAVTGLLQSKLVVNTPVTRLVESADGLRYLRQVNVGTNIGFDKFAGRMTSTMTVLTDKFGNLVTAFPGALK